MVNLAWEDYQDLRARQSVFESVTGWTWFRASVLAKGQTETSTAEIVDGDYFRTLGVRMQAGRALQPQDDRLDAPPVAVISNRLWHRSFGGTARCRRADDEDQRDDVRDRRRRGRGVPGTVQRRAHRKQLLGADADGTTGPFRN